jgi:hypothetical protein
MTAQVPDKLIADSEAIELPRMQLYGIVVGDPDDPKSRTSYTFTSTREPPKATMFSALWRGYVATYRLTADDTLVLERREYPHAKGITPEALHEPLHGDFWLDLRESFFGDGVLVPFVDGKIQTDRSLWRWRTTTKPGKARPSAENDAGG